MCRAGSRAVHQHVGVVDKPLIGGAIYGLHQRVLSIRDRKTKFQYRSLPLAGNRYGFSALSTRSGSPSCHPGVNVGATGRSRASPSSRPARPTSV